MTHPWTGLAQSPPDLAATRRRIAPFVHRTPIVELLSLSRRLGTPVLLKVEACQGTGSFKLRGAAAFLTSLSEVERAQGVVACSSGNHGRAVAEMAARLGVSATICLPDWVDPVKLAAIRGAGATAVLAGGSYDEAEAAALERARATGARFVPPFDDPEVIAGQGTLVEELLEEIPAPGRILVPLSGGGLMSGVGLALYERAPGVERVAVSAQRARVMLASLSAGHPVDLPEEPTLAGALAGGIGAENQWTLRLVERLVHRHLEVTEGGIADAIRLLDREVGIVAEGGGAVGVAALLEHGGALPPVEGPTVVVVSGGNLDPAVLEALRREG
jgi:threonine dehydratase